MCHKFLLPLVKADVRRLPGWISPPGLEDDTTATIGGRTTAGRRLSILAFYRTWNGREAEPLGAMDGTASTENLATQLAETFALAHERARNDVVLTVSDFQHLQLLAVVPEEPRHSNPYGRHKKESMPLKRRAVG